MIEAIVLVGGRGTRLQGLFPGVPKVLVPVQGRPFIDQVVEGLVAAGVQRIVLATGHLHEQVAAHFLGRGDAEFVLSAEPRPLGTGGAVKRALSCVHGDRVLVLNGDSICAIDYRDLVERHRAAGPPATIVVTDGAGREDGGNVEVDDGNVITGFFEKSRPGAAKWLNAGIYVFETDIEEWAKSRETCSLEGDVIPALVRQRACMAYTTDVPVLDIGTPERYGAANDRRL